MFKKIFLSIILILSSSMFSFSQSEEEALRFLLMGNEAFKDGQYEKALSYYEEALKIFRELKIPEGIEMSLGCISYVYFSLGQYEKARSYLEEALKIGRELKIHSRSKEEALRLREMGTEAFVDGQYEKALSYYEEALKIYRELKIPRDIAWSLRDIGFLYHFLGQYEKALSYLEEALKIRRELKIPEYIAWSLQDIGFVYSSLGQYEKALSYYEEALKISREFKIPQYIVASLSFIGFVYKYLGQYEKALSYHEEALKIKKELNDPEGIAMSLDHIGDVYFFLGQYEKALSYHEKALKIRREFKIPQFIGMSLYYIGNVYLALKDYKRAEELFKEGGCKACLVDLYIATGRFYEALQLLKDETPKWNTDDPHRILFHTQKGLALKGIGRLKEASSELLKAVSISEEMREKVKERGGFLAGDERIRAYRGLISALSEREINKSIFTKEESIFLYGKDLPSSAFYFSELTKARTLLEAIAESAKRYIGSELPPEIRREEEDILNQLSSIENQWDETYKKGEEAFKAMIERKERLKKKLESLILRLRKEYPLYSALKYPKPLPPEEIPLEEDEILLEYAITDEATYIFRLSKGKVERLIKIDKSKEELERIVTEFLSPFNREYREDCSSSIPIADSPDKYEDSFLKKGHELYKLLLEEALKDISSEKKLIIVPDGILGVLPFEALVIEAKDSYRETLYLGDKWTITYSQSATALALNRLLKASQAKKSLFALGNPVYNQNDPRYIAYKGGKSKPFLLAENLSLYAYRGLARGREWGKTTQEDKGCEIIYSPLPETENEVKAIAELFDLKAEPPDILLGVLANETNLRKSPLKDYRYLHFATHADLPGKVQGINVPFLLLGQVENRGEDDGFLTLTEVLGLKLDAEMVVLSACLTGRGRVMEGEGVMNFARAFQHAGARSVLVSLWEVASKEAVEYMEIFYKHIREGKSKGEALRLARKEMKEKHPNPFFWAVFILYGER